jgi:hypothetical protein
MAYPPRADAFIKEEMPSESDSAFVPKAEEGKVGRAPSKEDPGNEVLQFSRRLANTCVILPLVPERSMGVLWTPSAS